MCDVSERGGMEWLESLRDMKLSEAREELSALAGVGPKVASCVCLMSLDKHDAVPVDTHIYQVVTSPRINDFVSITSKFKFDDKLCLDI